MRFQLGYLDLKENEAILVGDPCYLKPGEPPNSMKTLVTGWPAGQYPVYVELEEDYVGMGGGNRVMRLRVYRDRGEVWKWSNMFEDVGELGVDSGQMMLAAAGVAEDWKDNFSSFDPDVPPSEQDYEATCRATLNTAISADLVRTRKIGIRAPGSHWNGFGCEAATAFACQSGYGDGVYAVNLIRDGVGGEVIGLDVNFGWDGDEDNDEDGYYDYDEDDMLAEDESEDADDE